ncbi:MAG: hypothetical protein P8Z42_14645, partial [Anaerolineales bacterium]
MSDVIPQIDESARQRLIDRYKTVDGNILTVWYVNCLWTFYYYDFIPCLLEVVLQCIIIVFGKIGKAALLNLRLKLGANGQTLVIGIVHLHKFVFTTIKISQPVPRFCIGWVFFNIYFSP